MFIVHVFDVFVLYFYFGVPCTFEVNIKCQLGEASEEGLFGGQHFFVPIIHARKAAAGRRGIQTQIHVAWQMVQMVQMVTPSALAIARPERARTL